MTHLFDTSAILAHHLAEPGAERIQALFNVEDNVIGICVLTLLDLSAGFMP